jgi:hypothetical protein
MLIAKSNIKFRSFGELYNYNPGDVILAKHEPLVKFYYSGQVVEDKMFNIRNATINVNFSKEPVVRSSVDELKESLETTTNVVKELKESIENIVKDKDTNPKKSSKKDEIKIIIDEICFPPSDDGIEMTGSVGESTSIGPDINHKVGKIKKVKNEERFDG